MQRNIAILAVTGIFSFSCKTTAKNSLAGSPETSAIPVLNCTEGMASSFTLDPLDFAGDASIVRYPDDDIQHELIPQATGGAPFLRLDTCIVNETINLRRVIFSDSEWTEPSIIPIDDQSIVNGMHDAVFSDDQSKLNIQQKVEGDSARTFVMTGWKQADGKTFATATFAAVTGTSIKPNSLNLLTGKLVAGDPIASHQCPNSLTFVTNSFNLNTANLEWDTCQGLGGGETTAYDVIALRITDSNVILTDQEKETKTFLTKEAVAGVLQRKWNHHNACDSFIITLPHVVYAASASPMAGCGEVLLGAPPRFFQGDDAEGKTKYTISYHGGEPTSGLLDCGHFLFGCTTLPE